MHFSVVHLALVTGILIFLVKLSSLRHWITLALCCFLSVQHRGGDGLWETAWMRPKEHLCISGWSSRILLLRCVCKSGPSLGSLSLFAQGWGYPAGHEWELLFPTDCCSPSFSHLLPKPPLSSQLSPSLPVLLSSAPPAGAAGLSGGEESLVCKLRPRRRRRRDLLDPGGEGV